MTKGRPIFLCFNEKISVAKICEKKGGWPILHFIQLSGFGENGQTDRKKMPKEKSS